MDVACNRLLHFNLTIFNGNKEPNTEKYAHYVNRRRSGRLAPRLSKGLVSSALTTLGWGHIERALVCKKTPLYI